MTAPKKPPMVSRIDLSAGDRRVVERIRQELTDRKAAGLDTAPGAVAHSLGRLEVTVSTLLRILDDAEVRP